MESGIYEGWVRHRRFTPVEHRFLNRIFLMYLDLDELERLFARRWCWSTRRIALAQFRRRDHLGDPQKTLAESVRDLVEEQGFPRPNGAIRLLTHLRYFGFMMNPVSFYFCFDQTNERVETIVAEVNNTPWGEQHCYVIGRDQFKGEGEKSSTEKEFHVSPFMPMEMEYFWRFSEPGQALTINIENQRQSEKVLSVTMQLKRREISTASLMRSLMRYPLMTWYVFAAIYWQALRLWIKRVPFYPHPGLIESSEENTSSRTP
ncbi:DUF1365 domain-containing protein [Gimesia fumaroli]|nr:DUF1365 domain-containing protein [Gimesia fumaroli]